MRRGFIPEIMLNVESLGCNPITVKGRSRWLHLTWARKAVHNPTAFSANVTSHPNSLEFIFFFLIYMLGVLKLEYHETNAHL
jgi:hypothetical protein